MRFDRSLIWLLFAGISSALVYGACGKKDDDAAADVPVATLTLGCGGKVCIGTEAQ